VAHIRRGGLFMYASPTSRARCSRHGIHCQDRPLPQVIEPPRRGGRHRNPTGPVAIMSPLPGLKKSLQLPLFPRLGSCEKIDRACHPEPAMLFGGRRISAVAPRLSRLRRTAGMLRSAQHDSFRSFHSFLRRGPNYVARLGGLPTIPKAESDAMARSSFGAGGPGSAWGNLLSLKSLDDCHGKDLWGSSLFSKGEQY
jgi:hypothetical protein